jgi:hypothetical protein
MFFSVFCCNGIKHYYVRFGFLIAVKIKIMVFWDVMPFNLIGRYQYFEETCCLQDRNCPKEGGSSFLQNVNKGKIVPLHN